MRLVRRALSLPPSSWIVRHAGMRGMFLLNLGILDVLYGFTIALPTPEQQQSVRYQVIVDLIPGLGPSTSLWLWAGIWWIVAALCLFYAWREEDEIAYGAAFALKIGWAIVNALGFAEAQPDGASAVLTWTAFALCVGIMSRMPEPLRRE